jgi:hypothetical protein
VTHVPSTSSQSSISRRARQGTVLLALIATGCAPLLTACGSSKPGNAASAALASVVFSGSWRVQKSPNAGGASNDNALLGVAATSATNAWAVGSYSHAAAAQTLVERWNGAAWTVQNSPNPGGASNRNQLLGVAATSASDAWAVGWYANGAAARTLVERWNGAAWTVQNSPNPGGASNSHLLDGVAATSATNAWAVGAYDTAARTLVERWNGAAWTVQNSPNPGGASGKNFLFGVAATSATNAWAVGYYDKGTVDRTLIEHWNGTAWTVQNSPSPGGVNGNRLYSVSATSATNAWAVGYYDKGTVDRTLIEHWNGTAWTVQPSPNTGSASQDNDLHAVAATSATNAFAVGYYDKGTVDRTLIEHWNGTAWTVQASPNTGSPSQDNDIHAAAATCASNAWAVGSYDTSNASRTLIEHRS